MEITKKTQQIIENTHSFQYEKLSSIKLINHFDNAEDIYILNYKVLEDKSFYQDKQLKYKEAKEIFSWSGFVKKEILETILDDPDKYSLLNEVKSNFFLINEKYLSLFQKCGIETPLTTLYTNEDIYYGMSGETDILAKINESNYILVQQIEKPGMDRLYIDMNGQLYSQPYIFDYLSSGSANLHNENYDLYGLVQELSKRDDIIFIVNGNKRFAKIELIHCPVEEDIPIDRIIQNIPSYNAYENCDKFIHIAYYPTQNDLKKIMNYQTEKTTDSKEKYIVDVLLEAEEYNLEKREKNLEISAKSNYKKIY